jgi:hypothetical protein
MKINGSVSMAKSENNVAESIAKKMMAIGGQ